MQRYGTCKADYMTFFWGPKISVISGVRNDCKKIVLGGPVRKRNHFIEHSLKVWSRRQCSFGKQRPIADMLASGRVNNSRPRPCPNFPAGTPSSNRSLANEAGIAIVPMVVESAKKK